MIHFFIDLIKWLLFSQMTSNLAVQTFIFKFYCIIYLTDTN